MNSKPMVKAYDNWLLIGFALVLLACGQKGGRDDGTSAAGSGGSVPDPAANVSGTFALGDAATPARNYSVWIYDQTAGTLNQQPLDARGAFAVPVTGFTQGHTYSFHLLAGSRLIGDLDLAPDVAGTQAACIYQGGLGFDLGQLVIPVDAYGSPSSTQGALSTKLGGGFQVQGTTDGSFAAFPLPDYASRVQFGSRLYVFDPVAILYSFYQRASNPSAYARDLRRLARAAFVTVGDTRTLQRVFLAQAGSWLHAARLGAKDDTPPEAAPLWSTGSADLARLSAGNFAIDVYSGGPLSTSETVLLRLQPQTGAEAVMPLVAPRGVSFPPQLMAYSGSGGTAATIDYSAGTANGLTQPFCQTGDVVLDLAPPLDDSGTAIAATLLDHVVVALDYYATSGGQTQAVTVDGTQLASPYNAPLVDTTLPGAARSWNPATLTVDTTVSGAVAAGATQEIRLWSQLFPSRIGTQSVSSVRLRIYYQSTTEATAAATAVWLKIGC